MAQQRNSIQILPPELRNQIAAGEVVERPASVVKELVENAVDAGADSIAITLENGGITLIRVEDNGCGIPRDELSLALTSHATSKIRKQDDLWSLTSFGFRGEALPSIASVATVRVESAVQTPEGPQAGWTEVDGGRDAGSGPSSLPKGTVIEVRDLFACIPARLKFLKTPSTEFKHIQTWLCRMALARLDITFTLSARKGDSIREAAHFTKGQTLISRLGAIWPQELLDNMRPFAGTSPDIRIHGLASVPTQTQSRPDRILTYVNGRVVNDKLLLHAIREAYKGYLISREYPQVILFVEIQPRAVDVNVHPAKSEVRFRDESDVFSAVMHAIRGAINGPAPSVSPFPESEKEASARPTGFWGSADQERIVTARPPLAGAACQDIAAVPGTPEPELPAGNEYVRETPAAYTAQPGPPGTENGAYESPFPAETEPEAMPERMPGADQAPETGPVPEPAPMRSMPTPCPDASPDCLADAPAAPPAEPPFRYLGQVLNTYLVLTQGAELVLMDQHAAHERILLNRLRRGGLAGTGQMLLVPLSIPLSPDAREYLEQCRETLDSVGFACEYDSGAVIVRAIPAFFSRNTAGEFIKSIANGLRDGDTEGLDGPDGLWSMMACKAAIKGGDALSPEEARALVTQWQSEDYQRDFCPHGRPIIIRLDRKELERLFKRRTS